MSTSGTDLDHDQVRVGDERLGVIHSGSRYVLGFGRDYYGIWEQGAPGGPAQRFPASEHGREAAWQRYIELEPSAEQVRAAQATPDEEVEERRRGWTRGRLITVGILGAVVILAIVLSQSNKSGTKSGAAGGGAVGSTAHIDISGTATVTEDLTQQSFEFRGFGTLYPQVEATWKGPTTTMHLSLSVPNVGTNTTNQNPFRIFDVTLQQTGSQAKFVSLGGECTIDLKTLEKDGISGTFDCTGIPSPAAPTTTINAKGTLSAKSS